MSFFFITIINDVVVVVVGCLAVALNVLSHAFGVPLKISIILGISQLHGNDSLRKLLDCSDDVSRVVGCCAPHSHTNTHVFNIVINLKKEREKKHPIH